MTTLRTVHRLQLMQLKRIDPTAHKAASTALANGFIDLATKTITAAMHAALTRLTAQVDPVTAIHTALTQHIEAGLPILVKGMTHIYSDRDIQAHLRRDDSDRLRLVVYRNSIPRSAYVGYYGRDDSRISSARAGCWKIAPGAKDDITRLLQESTR